MFHVISNYSFFFLFQEYFQKEKVVENLHQFGKNKNSDVIVLMGIKEIENNRIRRDLGVISLKHNTCVEKVLKNLLESTEPDLQLKSKEVANFVLDSVPFARFYEQINIKASRKQILPIVQKTIDSL